MPEGAAFDLFNKFFSVTVHTSVEAKEKSAGAAEPVTFKKCSEVAYALPSSMREGTSELSKFYMCPERLDLTSFSQQPDEWL